MKGIISIIAVVLATSVYAQQSEDLIPKQAISVFSINNVNLLQKISLDELVQYEFMEEVQQELFDGSTTGKTLKDSGIDFDQRLNVFIGRERDYEVTGMTFGVDSRQKLFEVFDDFESSASPYEGVDMFVSYFNRVAISGNAGVLFRITPSDRVVNETTDSIWYARGNDYPWYDHHDYGFEEVEPAEFIPEMETEENTTTPIDVEDNLPIADEDPTEKNYYELRDSVEMVLHKEYMDAFCQELFTNGNNLLSNAPKFKSRLNSTSEGTFYLDNSSSFTGDREFSIFRQLYPDFFGRMQELYTGNIMLGDLNINDNSIEFNLNTHYGEELGTIYEELTSSKFDKNMLKYIHKDDGTFFTYNVDLREAYEASYDVMMPILTESTSPAISSMALTFELLNEFINKDAIFDTYKGGMFGTYNGIQKIKTKKIIFEYDEETFDYTEQEVEAEEDMPIFTFGLATDRGDIAEKILKHFVRISDASKYEEAPKFINHGDYWELQNGVMNSASLYIINKNNLLIFTNNEDLAVNHSDGYGNEAMPKSGMKKALKGGAVYGFTDLTKAIEEVPREIFNDQENEMIDVFRGKSGTVELTSSKTTKEGTTFKLAYQFEGQGDSAGTYILDLINSLYVISK